jgi:tRNA pseudouridine55 synthase
MEGLLLVDKAKGSSSFQVVAKVRRALGTRAVGHVGTLDPLATGLLVFLVGRFTRLSNYLMAGTKKYRAVIELGSATNTDDKEGEVIASSPFDHIARADIDRVLPSFLGLQKQIPPAFSAISINGVRAYRRARAGEEVQMPEREIEIFDLQVIEFNAPLLTIDVSCSKGTYIRALARDFGARLGVPSHLADLRRTVCSEFAVEDALLESDLSDSDKVKKHLSSELSALKGIEIVEITNGSAARLKNGLRVSLADREDAQVVLAACGSNPVAICRIEGNQLITSRGF